MERHKEREPNCGGPEMALLILCVISSSLNLALTRFASNWDSRIFVAKFRWENNMTLTQWWAFLRPADAPRKQPPVLTHSVPLWSLNLQTDSLPLYLLPSALPETFGPMQRFLLVQDFGKGPGWQLSIFISVHFCTWVLYLGRARLSSLNVRIYDSHLL